MWIEPNTTTDSTTYTCRKHRQLSTLIWWIFFYTIPQCRSDHRHKIHQSPPPSSSILSNTRHQMPPMPILGTNKWRHSNNWPKMFNAQPSNASPTNHNHPYLSHLPRPIPKRRVYASIPVWQFQGGKRCPQWTMLPGFQQLQRRRQYHHPMFYPVQK